MDILTYDLAAEALERIEALELEHNTSKETINTLITQVTALQVALAATTPFDSSILNDYAKRIQTADTATIYIDKENNKAYKMYTVNNVLALEEVALPTGDNTPENI